MTLRDGPDLWMTLPVGLSPVASPKGRTGARLPAAHLSTDATTPPITGTMPSRTKAGR